MEALTTAATLDVYVLAVLFAVGFCAGVVDAIAGGGGLIALPVLLIAGLTPAQSIATNKIHALCSVCSSGYRFARAGQVDPRKIVGRILASMGGAVLGALAVQVADTQLLAALMPVLLIAVALFFLFARRLMHEASSGWIAPRYFALAAAGPIGFYDGFFGPGTGTLYAVAFVLLLGFDLKRANSETKILNAAGSAVAAVVFVFGGQIVWPAAIALSLGAVIGAQIGAQSALKWGAPLIRVALVTVSLGLAVKLLLE